MRLNFSNQVPQMSTMLPNLFKFFSSLLLAWLKRICYKCGAKISFSKKKKGSKLRYAYVPIYRWWTAKVLSKWIAFRWNQAIIAFALLNRLSLLALPFCRDYINRFLSSCHVRFWQTRLIKNIIGHSVIYRCCTKRAKWRI